jgi:hypothetical protein
MKQANDERNANGFLIVRPDGIPAELREGRRHVVWRAIKRNGGKPTKCLYQPDGRAASSTDPSTWSTFGEVMAAYEEGGWDGVGMIHSPEDNLVGADADHCIDGPDNTAAGAGADAVFELDTYTEVSPSGTGLRAYCRGKKPGRRSVNRKMGFELYDGLTTEGEPGGRYLTLTGHHYGGTPTTINERQPQVDAVYEKMFGEPSEPKQRSAPEAKAEATEERKAHGRQETNGKADGGLFGKIQVPTRKVGRDLTDDELLAKARGAANGAKFRALYDDGSTSGYPSHSEADQALCDLLAWWVGNDAARIDRLFRGSKLYRKKWERESYRKPTIANGIEWCAGSYWSSDGPPDPPERTDGGRNAGAQDEEAAGGQEFRNYYLEKRKSGGKVKYVVVGCSLQAIEADLRRLAGGWPRRVGGLLFAPDTGLRPVWLETPAQLFAWISGLLPGGRRNRLDWRSGPNSALVSESRLFASLTQTSERFEAIETYPHQPPLPGHYYLHGAVGGGDGKALARLLGRFAPATPVDGDLLRAMLLSLFWGGPAGSRPAWLFTADEEAAQGGRGVGKSTVPKMMARLVGGHIDLAANERMPDVITRLLSPDALERRVVLLDNVKALKFNWPELEALITADSISGHQLYHGEGSRPNTLTVAITLNGASLSCDLAQRCVIVKMKRPEYSGSWEQDTIDLIEAERWAIIGDVLAELRRPVASLAEHGRWGSWEAAVLAHVADPAACQKAIRERQEDADDDSGEADLVRDLFITELTDQGHDPRYGVVRIPTDIAARWCNAALGQRRELPKASAYLGTLEVPELKRWRSGKKRGWTWIGEESQPGDPAIPLFGKQKAPNKDSGQQSTFKAKASG